MHKNLSPRVWQGFVTRASDRLKTRATRIQGIGSKFVQSTLPVGLLVLAAGCAAPQRGTASGNQIRLVLEGQAEAWNAGKVEAFMEPYWRSPDLTFSSGDKVTRGWQATLDSYRKRYPTREAMGHLTFGDLEITALGREAALVLGRWHLQREEPVGGAFSLVLRREGSRWVIVHDHTSRDAP